MTQTNVANWVGRYGGRMRLPTNSGDFTGRKRLNDCLNCQVSGINVPTSGSVAQVFDNNIYELSKSNDVWNTTSPMNRLKLDYLTPEQNISDVSHASQAALRRTSHDIRAAISI